MAKQTPKCSIMSSRSGRTARRRPIIARLYLAGSSAADIHRQLMVIDGGQHSCGFSTVCRDIKLLEAAWVEELITSPTQARAAMLASINSAESACWRNFETSTDDRRLWLTELRGWHERKSKLLGLDAPLRQDVQLASTVSFVVGVGYLLDDTTPVIEGSIGASGTDTIDGS